MRMDIEGHEIEVFDSLINFSKNFQNHLPKKIIFETHFRIYEQNKKYVKEILRKIFERNISYDEILRNDDYSTKDLNVDSIIKKTLSSFPEEIKSLSDLAKPDIGIITSIGSSHLQNFKNVFEFVVGVSVTEVIILLYSVKVVSLQ